MNKLKIRDYKCKDEELPAICRNAVMCLKRDLTDFTAFSPVFNEKYIAEFEEKINLVGEFVCPKTEINELKKITKRLYETMDSLIDPIAKIRGYLLMAQKDTGVSAKDLGLAILSRKISDRNAEGTRQNLLRIIGFLEKYRTQLYAVGFNDSIIEQFKDAVYSITDDNQLHFNIVSKRKAIVQANVPVMNSLYAQLTDILNAGKFLYKGVDTLKYKEYSFSSQKKYARR
ncbi:MAG: hypothetical protein LBF59_00065 [Prevotellaceae bacterium]|jgi:hypothetical protein|nr:hypothetical protein [Prevotellaceae bacterium]